MTGSGLVQRMAAGFGRARRRFGWLDHVVRAVVRYDLADGGRLAAAVTYYRSPSHDPAPTLTDLCADAGRRAATNHGGGAERLPATTVLRLSAWLERFRSVDDGAGQFGQAAVAGAGGAA